MAGLVRPRIFPIRDVKDNKQDNGMIFNPYRYPLHGGFTDAAKYIQKAPSGLMDIDTPAKIKTGEIAKKTTGGEG